LTMRMLLNFFVLLTLVAAPAAAAPDEARGTVIGVDSGDVFDVQIDKSDPRIGGGEG
jgi:hypothetical protein